jgi:predicted nucleic acid-binding protein/uncharacterized protein YuzE
VRPRRGALKVVADTGPLVAAANRRDEAHHIARCPVPVIVETDHLLRARVGAQAAPLFLAALTAGTHEVAFLSAGLVRRAVEIDAGFGDLDLGFADAAVMAVAVPHGLPILTFDFEHFRSGRPRRGLCQLVIDGHYDPEADIAWLRLEGYDAATVVAEEVEAGLREIEPATGRVVGLEYWGASRTLPKELLQMLPPPGVATAA